MTPPIKKRINTELSIDRMAALYIQNGMIKVMVRVDNWDWLICGSSVQCAKDDRNEKARGSLFQNE